MKTANDLVTDAKARIREIPLTDAEQTIGKTDALLDVREPDEYAAGHLPGAVNIPRGMLEFKIGDMPDLASREADIVLYCKTDGRAALAVRSLQDMGYRNVRSIAGGFDAWAAAGKKIEK